MGTPVPTPVGANSPLSFTKTVIDSNHSGDCKAIADLNKDGRGDAIVGGRTLVYYASPNYQKVLIATSKTEFTTDCQAVDVNGDGLIDVVTADGNSGNNVIWFENKGPGQTFIRREVGAHGNWAHDIEVGDFDNDGKMDVITQGNGAMNAFFQNADGSWVIRNLAAIRKSGSGIGIGDINGDGRIDIVQGGWWAANPGARNGSWVLTQFTTGFDGSYTAAVGDLSGDGKPDVILAEQHDRAELSWFQAPANPSQGGWTKRILANDMGAHKINLVDLNRDGRLDVVTGLELDSLRVYRNLGNQMFGGQTLNSTGCHNTVAGDLNGDAYPDILCVNYIGNPPVEVYFNVPTAAPTPTPGNSTSPTPTSGTLALNRWTYVQVDSSRDWPYFGLAMGDVTRDGKADIASGRYFYRNPGGNMAGSWSRTAFPVNVDAMLIVDVDGDGQLDVIGEWLPNIYWLKPNADGSQWTAKIIATIPAVEHRNSQGYKLGRINPNDPKSQIVLTGGDGVYYLQIPQNPSVGNWSTVKIGSSTSEDLLAVGDLNGDGWDDVVASDVTNGKTLYWYQNPKTGAANWTRRTVGTITGWGDRAEMADINGDGRLDIITASENGSADEAQTFWFETPMDPTQMAFTRRMIADQGSTNSLSVADMDGDGRPEVITGEHRGALRVRIFKTRDNGQTWTDTLVSSGKESHLGARVFDMDGDGDLDILSIAYDNSEFLHLWRNDAK